MLEGHGAVVGTSEGSVRVLTLNRPSRLNALTSESYRALGRLLSDADDDTAVHVVLLRGAGRAFCSGVDLDALAGGTDAAPDLGETFDQLIEALLSLRKPLVAAVQGPAVGFGATILLHCDLVLVGEDAQLRYPFTLLGTAPEAGSSVLLSSAVGPQRAAELLLSSRWIGAHEAVAMGLALRSCAPDCLDEEALAICSDLAAHAPAALASTKRLLRAGRADAVRAAMTREREEAQVLATQLGPIHRPGVAPDR